MIWSVVGLMIWQLVAAGVIALGLSVLFHAPKNQYGFCALAGVFSWFFYSLCLHLSFHNTVAIFVATLALTIFCRFLAVARKAPVIIFLFAGIFPLVPGATVYRMALYTIGSEYLDAFEFGLLALAETSAIALGILFAFSYPRDKS